MRATCSGPVAGRLRVTVDSLVRAGKGKAGRLAPALRPPEHLRPRNCEPMPSETPFALIHTTAPDPEGGMLQV